MIDSIRQGANVRRGTEAYYAAEAGIEQALMVNKLLRDKDEAVGASVDVEATERSEQDNFLGYETSFQIIGTADDDLVKPINGKYIVPFPWTGDVPWTGDGAKVEGGCDPGNPPTLTNGNFEIDGATYDSIDHPCNWGMLKTGQKVSIPLYNGDETLDDFIVKVRTPCGNGKETCADSQRWVLNCYDKGEVRCVAGYGGDVNRGEVIMLWQVDAKDSSGNIVSLIPNDNIDTTPKYDTGEDLPSVNLNSKGPDTQIFEQRINKANNNEIIDSTNATWLGKLSTGLNQKEVLSSFLKDSSLSKHVLKLSLVGGLTGCRTNYNSCTATDTPDPDNPLPYIPYLEYQVVFNDSTNPPPNTENVIRATGKSGTFSHTLEVKVPHDTSSLEYVIQQ